MPITDGFTQRHDARSRRVLGAVVLERLDGRLLDVIRGGEVRLAGTEVDDGYAFGLEALAFRHYDGGG